MLNFFYLIIKFEEISRMGGFVCFYCMIWNSFERFGFWNDIISGVSVSRNLFVIVIDIDGVFIWGN